MRQQFVDAAALLQFSLSEESLRQKPPIREDLPSIAKIVMLSVGKRRPLSANQYFSMTKCWTNMLSSMSDIEIYTPTAEEVHSGELGRRMRQFNYQRVGEYAQVQPVWVSAKDGHGELGWGCAGLFSCTG